MEKYIHIITTAHELGIDSFIPYVGTPAGTKILEDTIKRRQMIEIFKYRYTQKIMDSRDERIRMQRELSKLLDIEVWEFENYTQEMRNRAQELREHIALHRAQESKYAEAKWELENI